MTNKTFLLLPFLLVVFIGIFLLAPQKVFALGTEAYPKKLRVLELRYFPAGNDYVYHPDTLSLQLQQQLKDSATFHKYINATTTPSVNVEIVEVANIQGKRPSGGGDWEASYQQILSDNNICQKIHDLDIDQLWVWADPRAGYDESPGMEYVISSPWFRNPVQPVTVPSTPFCGGQDSFVFMEFDFSRSADYALHSFGHFMEGLIANLQSGELFWLRYSGDNSSTFSKSERCGNVHFPPNATASYDYSNQSNVRTSCEDWNPAATGTKKRINCSRWGCSQQGYLTWWMQNMPNAGNTLTYQSKTLPNWWDFTVDMDEIIPLYKNSGTYYMNQAFLDANLPPVAPPASIGTTSTAKQNGGISISWSHTTEGENRLLVVSVAYRAAINPSSQIQSLTYAGQNLTFLRRDAHNHRVSEMWYLPNPPLGTANIDAIWSADPEDQVFAASNITGVDLLNPISQSVGAGSDLWDGVNPATESITVPSSTSEVVLGVLSTYPDGNSNLAVVQGATAPVWSTRTANNNIAGQGGAKLGASSVTLSWATAKNWSWAISAASIRLIPVPAVSVTTSTDKTSYIVGTDSTAQITTVVKNETGAAISGLSNTAFATSLDSASRAVDFTESTTAGTYTASLDLSTVSEGSHSLGVTVTDTRSLTGLDSASFTYSQPQQNATTAIVDSISYSLAGGKNNNRNLVTTVHVKNNLNASVSGAAVSINQQRSGSTVNSASASTNSSGNAVFTYQNAASGCYVTTITTLSASGLSWDGQTPQNQFCK